MWCCVKEFIHNKIFDTYYKIGDVSLELTSSVWKGPFIQIFVKFGNFHFTTMLAKVVIQVVHCFFLIQFLGLLMRLTYFLIRCHDGEVAEWLLPSFKTKLRDIHNPSVRNPWVKGLFWSGVGGIQLWPEASGSKAKL